MSNVKSTVLKRLSLAFDFSVRFLKRPADQPLRAPFAHSNKSIPLQAHFNNKYTLNQKEVKHYLRGPEGLPGEGLAAGGIGLGTTGGLITGGCIGLG